MLDEPIDFLELGSGSAVKTRLLIAEALRVQGTLRYSPIDISTERAARVVAGAGRGVSRTLGPRLRGRLLRRARFESLHFERRTLAMFMGSNIGNYEPAEARRLLKLAGGGAAPRRRPAARHRSQEGSRDARAAYDDPVGVTAAFNKNLLERINQRAAAATSTCATSRTSRTTTKRAAASIRSWKRAAPRASLVESIGMRVAFAEGERIHTESSYKFSDRDVAASARRAGFRLASTWHDRAQRFSVHLLVRA